MSDLIAQITADLQKQIDSFKPELSVSDIGTVYEAGDGIARARGTHRTLLLRNLHALSRREQSKLSNWLMRAEHNTDWEVFTHVTESSPGARRKQQRIENALRPDLVIALDPAKA